MAEKNTDQKFIKVFLNGGQILEVPEGETLLSALIENDIFIPSACGGHGKCGFCKVKILKGPKEPLPAELPRLTPADKQNGIRLSCQIPVREEMEIEIPQRAMNIKPYDVRVYSIRDLTYDIKEVTLTSASPIEFRAGQYIQVQIPSYENSPRKVIRAYSIASAPSDKGKIEVEVRLVPNGIGSTFVHNRLRVGDRLKISGPYGTFFLRSNENDILFIAGGSGMAPVKSMILDMAEKGTKQKITYFFGAKTKKDLFLEETMVQLEKRLPKFHFIPALSNLEPGDPWIGEAGLITEVVGRHPLDGSRTDAYLCGSPGMIDACLKVLTMKGIPENRIFYDQFM